MDMLSIYDAAQDWRFVAAENLEAFRFASLRDEVDGVRAGLPAAGGFVAGVFQGRTEAGQWACVRCVGLTRLEVAEGVRPGDYICAGLDGSGRLALPGELARAVCILPGREGESAVVLLCLLRV